MGQINEEYYQENGPDQQVKKEYSTIATQTEEPAKPKLVSTKV